jgi:hypothetical protein
MTNITQTKIVTLKQLCKELKVKPREARMMLRLAVSDKSKYPALIEAHTARQPWKWDAGTNALTEAKKAILASD